ncbi:MAG: hypothetical protein HY883_04650 [Deltaproteobacteria bacterium]|nr:hypothetical protein [Deltaproteobacteria bacterium]
MLNRIKGTGLHDELYHRLNVLNTDIVRLEYTLDIAVVTKNFSFIDRRGQTIGSDVSNIEKSVSTLKDQTYTRLFPGSSSFTDLKTTVLDNWQTVKNELGRLDTAKSEEEMLLIHNTVDLNTFVLADNVERMLSFVQEEKNTVFREGRDVVLFTLILSLLAGLGGGLVFFARALLPFRTLFSSLSHVVSAGTGSRVRENLAGEVGGIARAINAAIGRAEKSYLDTSMREKEAMREIGEMVRKIESLNVVTSMVSRSLSQFEVTMRAISEVCATIGADAGSLYLMDGGGLRLKVSKGFSGTFFYKGEELPLSERTRENRVSEKPIVFASMDEYPEGRLKSILVSEGIKTLVSVPVLHEGMVAGFFEVAFRKYREIGSGDLLFFQAISSNLGVAASYSDAFSKEHATRIFLERIIQHSPLGVAAFDLDGVCLLANSTFKKHMGCDQRSDFVGSYRVFDDGEFERQGVIPMIKKSYEGMVVEFTADYDGRFQSAGGSRRLRIKSAPLYDAGGSIPSIVMLLDDVTPVNHSQLSPRGNP